MLNAATTPINAAVSNLTQEIASIQCKLPNTVTLPYSCAVPLVYNLYGANTGLWA